MSKDKKHQRNKPSKFKLKNHGKPQVDSRKSPRDENLLSKVYGINAAKIFAKKNQSKIIRAFFTEDVAPQFSDLMKQLAAQKKVYRIVPEGELEKISQSQHHEGVCFNIELDPPLKLAEWFNSQKSKKTSMLLALENVGNPHNLGAIMRIAAHFGVEGIAMPNPKALQSGAARRTAEGGAEFIQAIECENMKSLITLAKKQGYSIMTTSSHKGENLYKAKFPDKCVLLFGEEGPGLSKEILSAGDVSIQIPGTKNVESLNVSTAIAIILGEYWSRSVSQ